MKTRTRAALLLLIVLSGCMNTPKSYTRIHDVALRSNGHSIVMLVERGRAQLDRGFTPIWTYETTELAVWNLDRDSGKVSREDPLVVPADLPAYFGAPTLAKFASQLVAGGTTVPNCTAALTHCAVQHTPQPYVVRDLSDGQDRGLKLIDPGSGVVVRGVGAQLKVEPWTLRTSIAVEQAATAAMRNSVQLLFNAGLRDIKASLASAGAFPAERSVNIHNAINAGNIEGLITEYFVDIGGIIGAKITYANEESTNLRWTPTDARQADGMPAQYRCEADRSEAVKWYSGCVFSPRPKPVDPETVYLLQKAAQLKAEAAKKVR